MCPQLFPSQVIPLLLSLLVALVITCDGAGTTFQGNGSMAKGNSGDSSGSDSSSNHQPGSETGQLPACKDEKMLSPDDDLLQAKAANSPVKEGFISEAEKHCLASHQVSPAESLKHMNKEKIEAGDKVLSEGKTQTEDTETTGAMDKAKTEAEPKVNTNQTKRTSNIIPSHSNGAVAASKKNSVKGASPPKADPPAAGSLPCSRRVGATNVGEPRLVPHVQRVLEEAQDTITVHIVCVEFTINGQRVQMQMVQMVPHDSHYLPSPQGPHLPFPSQESEEGQRRPSQLVLPVKQ